MIYKETHLSCCVYSIGKMRFLIKRRYSNAPAAIMLFYPHILIVDILQFFQKIQPDIAAGDNEAHLIFGRDIQ